MSLLTSSLQSAKLIHPSKSTPLCSPKVKPHQVCGGCNHASVNTCCKRRRTRLRHLSRACLDKPVTTAVPWLAMNAGILASIVTAMWAEHPSGLQVGQVGQVDSVNPRSGDFLTCLLSQLTRKAQALNKADWFEMPWSSADLTMPRSNQVRQRLTASSTTNLDRCWVASTLWSKQWDEEKLGSRTLDLHLLSPP